MRQILFKAKRVDNGEWIEGYYFYNPNIDRHFVHNWLSGGLVEVDKRKQAKVARKALKQISLVGLEDIFKKIVNGIARGFKIIGEAFTNAGNSLEVK
jgi:hypothetical protein